MNAWDPTIVKLLCSLWTFVYQKVSCLRIGLCMYGHWLILFESRNVSLSTKLVKSFFRAKKVQFLILMKVTFWQRSCCRVYWSISNRVPTKKDWFHGLISWLKSTKAGHGSFGGNYYLTRFRVDTFVLCHTEECAAPNRLLDWSSSSLSSQVPTTIVFPKIRY